MLPSAALAAPTTIWTIGHSTRPIEEFLSVLAGSRIEVIADVRSFPGSRRYPQYGREALAATLVAHAIGYHWLPALGGRRRVRAGVVHDDVARQTARPAVRRGADRRRHLAVVGAPAGIEHDPEKACAGL